MSKIKRKRKSITRRQRPICRRCSRRRAVSGGNVCTRCARVLLRSAFAGMSEHEFAAVRRYTSPKGGIAFIEPGYAREHEAELRARGARPLAEVIGREGHALNLYSTPTGASMIRPDKDGLCPVCCERPRIDASTGCLECSIALAQRAFTGLSNDEILAIIDAGGGKVYFAFDLANPLDGPVGWIDPETGIARFPDGTNRRS